MSCRDCRHWDLTTLRSNRGEVEARCKFDADSITETLPQWVGIQTSSSPWMATNEGLDCPQFAPRVPDAD